MSRWTRAGGLSLCGVLLALGSSCAGNSWDQAPRPVRDLPPEFQADAARAPAPGYRGCAVHLLDSLSGATLQLNRSTSVHPNAAGVGATAIGDYQVTPLGRYGLRANEYLRLECPSGRPLGAVH